MKSEKVEKEKRFSRIFKFLTTFFVLLVIWIFLAPLLANLLIVEKTIERADAIWVLGGSATYLERNRKAAELYKQGFAAKIFVVNDGVLGGWNKQEQRNIPFSELAKRELVAQGVPNDAVEILPKLVEGTKDEADLFVAIAKERNLKSVLLVTSAYHSRRTLWTFDRAVLKNNLSVEVGLQSPPTGVQTPPPFTWWLNRKGWRVVGEEYVKIPYYWAFY